MNPVFAEAGESARLGWVMGLLTIQFLVAFCGWAWWAWRAANRSRFEAASLLPFDDGEHA
jgi:cbb3-type cytochrome oxidase subunit 3